MVCQGHDLVALMVAVIPAILASLVSVEASEPARKRLWEQPIDSQLRAAYEARFFRTTRLYAAIRDWEQRNPPYTVLAPDV